MKYKYIGKERALLIDYHIEVLPGDVVDVDGEINNVFFVPVDEKKTKGESDK